MDTKRITTMDTLSKSNPFTVPEGYFDTLTARVMANVDAQVQENVVTLKPTKHTHWKVWTSGIAACVAGALLCINLIDKEEQPTMQNTAMLNEHHVEEAYAYDEQYQKEVMDYAMVDYNDVYNYLSGAAY